MRPPHVKWSQMNTWLGPLPSHAHYLTQTTFSESKQVLKTQQGLKITRHKNQSSQLGWTNSWFTGLWFKPLQPLLPPYMDFVAFSNWNICHHPIPLRSAHKDTSAKRHCVYLTPVTLMTWKWELTEFAWLEYWVQIYMVFLNNFR